MSISKFHKYKNIDACVQNHTNVYILLYFCAFVKELALFPSELTFSRAFVSGSLYFVREKMGAYCCIFASFSARVVVMLLRSFWAASLIAAQEEENSMVPNL